MPTSPIRKGKRLFSAEITAYRTKHILFDALKFCFTWLGADPDMTLQGLSSPSCMTSLCRGANEALTTGLFFKRQADG
jgi:hypothetical protein